MIFNLCTLYLHFSVFRHRIAINVTVLRCYAVTDVADESRKEN